MGDQKKISCCQPDHLYYSHPVVHFGSHQGDDSIIPPEIFKNNGQSARGGYIVTVHGMPGKNLFEAVILDWRESR
jgi:hypothetical protein